MTRFWQELPALAHLARMVMHSGSVYRANIVINAASMLVQLYVLNVVWTATYVDQGAVDNRTLSDVLCYVTLGNLQMWVMFPYLATTIQRRVWTGRIAMDMTRPVSFVNQLLAQQAGITASLLPYLLILVPAAIVLGQLRPPHSPIAFVQYVASIGAGYLVALLTSFLLGVLAFWTLETTGFLALYRFATQLFAGALVPLWLFPEPLRVVAGLLPFQAQAALPASIYLGLAAQDEVARALLIQVAWVAGLFVVARIVWTRALPNLVIHGG